MPDQKNTTSKSTSPGQDIVKPNNTAPSNDKTANSLQDIVKPK
jgi:hypothetical protein